MGRAKVTIITRQPNCNFAQKNQLAKLIKSIFEGDTIFLSNVYSLKSDILYTF